MQLFETLPYLAVAVGFAEVAADLVHPAVLALGPAGLHPLQQLGPLHSIQLFLEARLVIAHIAGQVFLQQQVVLRLELELLKRSGGDAVRPSRLDMRTSNIRPRTEIAVKERSAAGTPQSLRNIHEDGFWNMSNAPWVRIDKVGEHVGEIVEIRGWLSRLRSSGKLSFLQLRDGSANIQGIMAKADVAEEIFAKSKSIGQESSLRAWGKVSPDERAPGGFELHLTDIEVLHAAEGYPITPKEHGTDFLMDHRHLWLRSNRQHAILKIRAEIMKGIIDWLDDHDFLRVDTPILTPSACEGTTTLFETEYFDSKAYLAQSGQLYNEATAMAFGKVYTFGPTFRAEKSKTRRHLMEFWMVEPEMAFCDFESNLEVQEQMLEYVVQRVIKKRAVELKVLQRDVSKLEQIKAPFVRLSYDDAVKLLNEKGVEFAWGGDFGGGDETIIAESFDRPVFVHRFPTAIKAFYMKPDPERPEVVLGADLLAPEGYGEIIGGGQRIDDLELLEKRLAEHNLPPESYAWYVDLRRYGSVPHGGFGLGLERTVAWICGLEHVRETIPFPRMLSRLYP